MIAREMCPTFSRSHNGVIIVLTVWIKWTYGFPNNQLLYYYRRVWSMRRQKETYQPIQSGDRLYTSEYDVCRRQILTYKDGPHTEITKLFIMVVDP